MPYTRVPDLVLQGLAVLAAEPRRAAERSCIIRGLVQGASMRMDIE